MFKEGGIGRYMYAWGYRELAFSTRRVVITFGEGVIPGKGGHVRRKGISKGNRYFVALRNILAPPKGMICMFSEKDMGEIRNVDVLSDQ